VFRFRGDGPLEAKDRVDATDAREEGGSVHDQGRIDYMRTHIKVMGDTVELDGVDLVGYAPWGGWIDVVPLCRAIPVSLGQPS